MKECPEGLPAFLICLSKWMSILLRVLLVFFWHDENFRVKYPSSKIENSVLSVIFFLFFLESVIYNSLVLMVG